jgi:integrase
MNDRKHLVSAEVDKFIEAAKDSRNAARDRCFLLLMFRHGLRVSEACGLKLSQVDTESRVLRVARLVYKGHRNIQQTVIYTAGKNQAQPAAILRTSHV